MTNIATNVVETDPLSLSPKNYKTLELVESQDSVPVAVVVHQSPLLLFVRIAGYTLGYWFLSGGLTFFNKWFFSLHGFRFPILVVMCTLVMHTLITSIIRCFPMAHRQSVSRRIYLRYLIPIAVCTGLEISTSNLALVKLTLSFHTMVHASKPVFFTIWGLVLGLEQASWKVFVSVSMVTVGVLLLSLGEMYSGGEEGVENSAPSTFDAESFWLLLFSCFISGLRWSVAQLMLQRVTLDGPANEKMTPLNMLFYVSPVGALSLLPFFVFRELSALQVYMVGNESWLSDLLGFGMLISCWALFLTLLEFYFIKSTSAVFFSFAAILKELLVVCLSILVNGDGLPFLNVVGFLLCISGIVFYQRSKLSKYDELKG